jgi:predicted phosphodiesterase
MSRNNRILFAGDPHGDFQSLIDSAIANRPDAVVLLGDCDLERPLEHYLQKIIALTRIWWIPGNHDFDFPRRYHYLFNSELAEYGLHLKVHEIAGLRIAGLGGIFLGRIWYPPQKPRWKNKAHYLANQSGHIKKNGLSLKLKSAIWHDEVESLKRLKADILVTHEAPGCHEYGFSAIDDIAKAMGVKKIFHGHQHDSYYAKLPYDIEVFGVADRSVVDLSGKVYPVKTD